MGQLHDAIADTISSYFISKEIFGKRYLATNVPLYPRPDFVLLSRSKEPNYDLAFEVKPPHADKREYMTGLGQSISYLQYYPVSYLIIPDEVIDGFSIPSFMAANIQTAQLSSIGLITYDISNFAPNIEIQALPQKNTPKKISHRHSRPWLFWMDTSIEEIAKILILIACNPESSLDEIKQKIWLEVLSIRYENSTRPQSYILNYSLFLSSLELWDGEGKLTVIGNRLKEISTQYDYNSIEFKNALHYLILTKGGYLRLLKLVQKFQDEAKFDRKGSAPTLDKEIKKLRKECESDKSEDLECIVEKFESEGKEWLRLLACQALREGYGKDLSQVLDDISRRFSPYFHKYLDTGFLHDRKYLRGKGYSINWSRIISLIEKGDENLRVF